MRSTSEPEFLTGKSCWTSPPSKISPKSKTGSGIKRTGPPWGFAAALSYGAGSLAGGPAAKVAEVKTSHIRNAELLLKKNLISRPSSPHPISPCSSAAACISPELRVPDFVLDLHSASLEKRQGEKRLSQPSTAAHYSPSGMGDSFHRHGCGIGLCISE